MSFSSSSPAAAIHAEMASSLRFLAMDAVEASGSGHPGMPMGMADVAVALWSRFLKFDASRPDWPDRDRFVLSAGHGSMLLYGLLHLSGHADMTMEALKRFRRLDSRCAGHPEYGAARGVEATTGPLGQGLANAVGMALAERMMNARHGDDLVDHRIYAMASDGCLMEGISHEAADLAGHWRLGRLIVLFDDNGISIDGETRLSVSTDQRARFAAAGWHVSATDGHDPEAIAAAIAAAIADERPSLIACRTTIGYGAPGKEGKASAHGAPLGADEIAAARRRLGWPHPPFAIPQRALAAWREAGRRAEPLRLAWEERLSSASPERRAALTARNGDEPAAATIDSLREIKRRFLAEAPISATRRSSLRVLEALGAAEPRLIGGSADLSGSNGVKTKAARIISRDDFSGNYIHYGVREHGMAAAMNGMALHGGFIPYGGTFLAFSDYSRPALRLAALMKLRVIHVLSHDSIGLGEDGPTHQPVEHLASLRAIPDLLTFRPADATETAEAWMAALEADLPSVLCLSRQATPPVRDAAGERGEENLTALGGYVLREPAAGRDVTLAASGSEVALCLQAAAALADEGTSAAVVSLPCWELFERRSPAYRAAVLGAAPRIGVEAASGFGWERILGEEGVFIGMKGFGASAPADDLYRCFDITVEATVAAARRAIAERRGG